MKTLANKNQRLQHKIQENNLNSAIENCEIISIISPLAFFLSAISTAQINIINSMSLSLLIQ